MSEAALERGISGAGVVDARLLDDLDAAIPAELPAVSRHPRVVDPAGAARNLPRGDLGSLQRSFRHWVGRLIAVVSMKTWFRIQVVGAERLGTGPVVYCVNHLCPRRRLFVPG